MISIVTVPNTGTIYTMHLLRGWGVEIERKHLENTDKPPYGDCRFGPGFPCGSTAHWEAYPEDRRVVCTLRDPILAVISAINRGVPDRMISVDGWAVMADWHQRITFPSVHFFPIPPTQSGLVWLASFVGHRDQVLIEASREPRNTFEDPDGLKAAYEETGVIPEHPTLQRCVEQLAEMPAVEELFKAHGFGLLPWFEFPF